MTDKKYDTLIRNVKVARPKAQGAAASDSATVDGRSAEIAPVPDIARARAVVDGKGLLAFTGVVDAHMHTGI